MAFSASHIEITLRYTVLSQECQTARQYTWDGAAIAAATAVQVGEAWWNHVKAAWRALVVADAVAGEFKSVLVREIGGSLSYGEYPIPVGEKLGTRSATGLGAYLPSYCAVGVRLSVGSSVTRPGQMRIPFMTEFDNDNNNVHATFQGLVNTLADLYDAPNTLGAPVATGVLTPNVVRYGNNPDTLLASQPIIGHVTNTSTTSQVSRRKGHGS